MYLYVYMFVCLYVCVFVFLPYSQQFTDRLPQDTVLQVSPRVYPVSSELSLSHIVHHCVCIVLYCTVLYCTVITALWSTAIYISVLYYTVVYCTVMY